MLESIYDIGTFSLRSLLARCIGLILSAYEYTIFAWPSSIVNLPLAPFYHNQKLYNGIDAYLSTVRLKALSDNFFFAALCHLNEKQRTIE